MTCCRRPVWGPIACDDERRAPAVKSGVPLITVSPVKRFCFALSFHRRIVQTFTTCGPSVTDLDGCVVLSFSPTRCPDFHHLRPLGHRPRRRRSANRRFRPWRPAAAAAAAVAAGWTSFWEQLTPCCQRSTPFVPNAVRSRRRSPDPQIVARGALAVAARLPQF